MSASAAPDDTPVREPHTREGGYTVDKSLHEKIQAFFRDLEERNVERLREINPPELRLPSEKKGYLLLSVSGSAGEGRIYEEEYGVAIGSDLSGGFFHTTTRGYGGGFPVGGAANLGLTHASSAEDLAGPEFNVAYEPPGSNSGVTISVAPGDTPTGPPATSMTFSLGEGPTMPASTSVTEIMTFHEIFESLEKAMARYSGDQDVRLWTGEW